MFKLESFVTPLLAHYLNKYIKDLKADDLQLSLWKGEAVLNNLDLRLDVIEEDLGLPFTFVSGSIQELRIKVPWTRLTAERVVITVNTMECVMKLSDPANKHEEGIATDNSKHERKTPVATSTSTAPPPGYMESLSTRVLNNVQIHFVNLILRYIDDDFVLNGLVKSANYFTVNDRWEKAFVEVSQPDSCLRRVLVFQDVHLSINKHGADPEENTPLLERAFVTCRFLTKFDGPDCRVILSSVINVLCDELHITILDQQIPMVRRLVSLALAFQAGALKSRRSVDNVLEGGSGDATSTMVADQTDDSVISVTNDSWSWTSWALSFIPAVPSDPETAEASSSVQETAKVPGRASTVALYGRKITITLAVVENGTNKMDDRRRPLLRLETDHAFLTTKSREAKFFTFRGAVGSCRIVALDGCPCGHAASAFDLPVLSFAASAASLFERTNFLGNSLFGTSDDEKEISDSKAPFESFESYLSCNTDATLLDTYGVIVVDSVTMIELPDDCQNVDLMLMSAMEMEYSNLKQYSSCRVLVSPPLLILDSSSFHRFDHVSRWVGNYKYASYEEVDGIAPTTVPEMSDENLSQLLEYIPLKHLYIVMQKPKIVLLPPNHASMPPGLTMGKPFTMRKDELLSKESGCVILQTERIEFHQSAPFYPGRLMKTAASANGLVDEALQHCCYIHLSVSLVSLDLSLGMFASNSRRFSDIRALIVPTNVEYNSRRPVDATECEKLWGSQNDSNLSCLGIEFGASLPEVLFGHLTAFGLLRDMGSYLAHASCRTVVQNVFDALLPSDDILRINVKCGKIKVKLGGDKDSSVFNGRVTSIELSLHSGGSAGSISPFLSDCASGIADSGSFNLLKEDGRMRASAHNACFRSIVDPSSKEVLYALYFPASSKITVYPQFIRKFAANIGTTLRYHADVSYANLFRESAASDDSSADCTEPSPFTLEVQHEKFSLDILDSDFEFLSASINSGRFTSRSAHANITSFAYEMRALLLNLGRSGRDPILGPVSGSFSFVAFGLHATTAGYISGDISLIPFRIGPNTLPAATKAVHEFLSVYGVLAASMDVKSPDLPFKQAPGRLQFIVSGDDLRKEQWRYREQSTSSDPAALISLPDVNEIRFYESSVEQTMAWRYPELRTIASVLIIPMPFHVSQNFLESGQKIVCSLQYLKRPLNTFVDLRSFTLTESQECMFTFPDILPEDFDRLPVSDVWRVKMTYGIQEESDRHDEQCNTNGFPVSIKSLAGCMKISSGIMVGVPSTLHASLTVGVASVALMHHVPILPRTPGHSLISGFAYDTSYPCEQEFSRIKFDKVTLLGRLVGKQDSLKATLDSSFWVDVDFVNYRFLTVQPLLESAFFSSTFTYTMDDKMYVQAKVDCKTPLVIHVGQNVLHTLSMASVGWKMARTGSYPSLPIINHLIVCNDTYHVIRIRQYTTDECVYIKPKEMHPYSWRSQRVEQKLQCSVETYPNLWSEPCQLDVSMTQLCSFPVIDNQEIGLICSLRALNNIQKQVILATQFMISNKLDSDLEIQLFTEPDYVSNPLVETAQESMLISANTQSSTRCLPLSKIKRCRIRFRGGLWSETIPTPGTDVHHLVTIPDVGKIVCDSWVTFVDPVVPQKTRWMVVSPVMIGRSHFPDPLKLEVWRGDVRLLEQLAECDEDFSMPVWPAQDDYEIRIFKNNESKDEPQRFNVNIRAISAQLGPRACVVDGSSLLNDSVMKRSLAKVSGKTADEAMPNITTPDFCIYFERRWAYADTILLHVKANGVNIQNNYDDDLVLYGVDDELVLLIPRRRTAVLPFSQKGQLRLGVQSGGTVHLSDYFDIRPSQEAREPGMDCTGMAMLPSGGYLTVTFWQKRDDQFLIHHLTMSLKEERSVKTLTIGSRFVALRTSDDASDVLLSAFVVPKVHTKLNYEDELKRVPSDKLTRQVVQLSPFVYVVPRDYPVATDPNRVTDILTYICLACETGLEVQWSYPRQIKESKNKKTFVATITAPVFAPVDGSNVAGLCFRMTAVEDNGVCYYLFERTDSPNLILMNNCPYPISFGECVRKGGGVVTFEEKELFQPLPSVQPGATASYSFPGHDEQFPNVYRASPIYRLRLGRAVKTGSAQAVVVWSSTSVDPYAALNDCFVSVPGVCYLKLHFERENRHTIRISIDPLSRVGTPILLPTLAPPKSVAMSELPSPPPLSSRASTPATALLPPTPLNVGISCLLKSVILTVDDEISNPSVIAEVLRLSVDDTSVQFYCDGQTTKTYECAVNISDIQLDNQLYKCGFFDFPVILAKENPAKNVQSVLNVLCKLNSSTLRPENVHISLAPVACFLEDTFAFHLLRLVDTYLAPALLVSDAEKSGASTEAMISRFQRMSVPVVLERIHVAPVEMYLSIHASLKMFVALDKTPLSFGEIECNDVNSTVTDVWNFVMSHYIRGTLLRAGWVIGSMDLLGNPASLLRSLTSGCNDLFVRPFSSLHAGPVSFLNGLAEGASSFLSSVSAGTLSSLTNLAESLSRNLDRVSLDADHVVRQMEVKYRQHPEGLGSGLRQGLTGFGMGILGAVAGLVDQPMQAVMQPQLTPAQMVTALVLGITKGMVGAMSKPIAGAAGLVSKTGQGILRGHGFSNFPPRRFDAPLKLAASFMESTLKYIWKVAPLLPNNVRTLCVVEAIPAVKSSEGDTSDPMCLFLSDSALFVISSADDEFRQAYSLSKLNIRINQSSPWSNKDLVQVTLLIEMDMEEKIGDSTEDFSWPWMTWNNCAVVISPTHSREIIGAHVNKESFLLEWKDAKLFEELFLVAKSGV